MVGVRDARALAVRDQREDRVELAEAHLATLERKVPRITIASENSPVTITLDGRSIATAVLGTAIPVDPGDHVVEASADAKVPFRTELFVSEESSVTLTIPLLEAAQEQTPKIVAAEPPPARIVTSNERPRHTPAIITASIGAVAICAGSIFGVRAIGQHDDAKTACTSAGPCNATPAELNDSAKTSADVATVLIGTGSSRLASARIFGLLVSRLILLAEWIALRLGGGG